MSDSRALDSKILEYIIQNVCKEIGAQRLTDHHRNYVIQLYRSMDPKIFAGHKVSKIGPILGRILGNKLQALIKSESAEEIDIKEYQKAAIGSADQDPEYSAGTTLALDRRAPIDKSLILTEFLGINDLDELKMFFNPESMYVHYLSLIHI